jgi:hypothetical protein
MRWSVVAVAAGALFITASAIRASADAWSAAAAVEREAIKVHPWDPESFRHPEQYGEDGHKLPGAKSAGKSQQNPASSAPRP